MNISMCFSLRLMAAFSQRVKHFKLQLPVVYLSRVSLLRSVALSLGKTIE